MYAFIIFFLATVWAHLGTGPFHYNEYAASNCRLSPWANLLYVNNFVGPGGKYATLDNDGTVIKYLLFIS